MHISEFRFEFDRHDPHIVTFGAQLHGDTVELSKFIGALHMSPLTLFHQLVDTGESSTYGHPFGSTAVQVAIDALPEGKWRHFAVRVG